MFYFLLFISFISGLILININYWFIGASLLLLLLFEIFKLKLKKIKIIILLSIFLLGIIISLIDIPLLKRDEYILLIIEKKDNYFIGFDGFKKVYVSYSSSSITNFSLVKIKGSIGSISFHNLESEFDFTNYLANKGIKECLYINKIENIFINPISLNGIKERILDCFSIESRAVVSSLLFKEVDYNSSTIKILNTFNLTNLFSLSGIYLSFFIDLIYKLLCLKFSDNNSRLISLILALPVLVFSLTSFVTIRIIIFKVIYIILGYKNIRVDRLKFLCISGLVFLFIDHYLIYQSSFIIYYLITIVLYFSKLLLDKYRKVKKRFYTHILLYFILLPFLISFSNQFNVLSLFISFIFIPVSKVFYLFLTLGIYGINISFLSYPIEIYIKIIKRNGINLVNIYVPPLNQFYVVIYYLVLFFFIYFLEVRYFKPVKFGALVSTFIVVIYALPLKNWACKQVYFINVGQGDSTLINLNGETILIDTGGLTYKDVASSSLIPFFKKNRIYQIDHLFVTHNDFDHMGAVDSLKANFKVKNIYNYNSSFPITINNTKFENLNIYQSLWSEENAKSLVLKFSINKKIFLMMGDATKIIEKKLIEDGIDINCDYLKVGHHGSNSSSLDDFIKKCSPSEAIISCGYNNRYNHPHKEVISILNKYKVKIRRTDLEGTIYYCL